MSPLTLFIMVCAVLCTGLLTSRQSNMTVGRIAAEHWPPYGALRFLLRDAMLARYMLPSCVCQSVCLSVHEVDRSVSFSCQIFSGFNVPKIIKIG